MKFEARTCNLALEESSFGGGWAPPSPRRLDNFLEDLHGASSADRRRDLKFSKWQTKILQHSPLGWRSGAVIRSTSNIAKRLDVRPLDYTTGNSPAGTRRAGKIGALLRRSLWEAAKRHGCDCIDAKPCARWSSRASRTGNAFPTTQGKSAEIDNQYFDNHPPMSPLAC